MRDVFKMAGFVFVMIIVAAIVRNVAAIVAIGSVEAGSSWNAWRETLPIDPNLVVYATGAVLLVGLGLASWAISRRQKRELAEAVAKARAESEDRNQDLIRFD